MNVGPKTTRLLEAMKSSAVRSSGTLSYASEMYDDFFGSNSSSRSGGSLLKSALGSAQSSILNRSTLLSNAMKYASGAKYIWTGDKPQHESDQSPSSRTPGTRPTPQSSPQSNDSSPQLGVISSKLDTISEYVRQIADTSGVVDMTPVSAAMNRQSEMLVNISVTMRKLLSTMSDIRDLQQQEHTAKFNEDKLDQVDRRTINPPRITDPATTAGATISAAGAAGNSGAAGDGNESQNSRKSFWDKMKEHLPAAAAFGIGTGAARPAMQALSRAAGGIGRALTRSAPTIGRGLAAGGGLALKGAAKAAPFVMRAVPPLAAGLAANAVLGGGAAYSEEAAKDPKKWAEEHDQLKEQVEQLAQAGDFTKALELDAAFEAKYPNSRPRGITLSELQDIHNKYLKKQAHARALDMALQGDTAGAAKYMDQFLKENPDTWTIGDNMDSLWGLLDHPATTETHWKRRAEYHNRTSKGRNRSTDSIVPTDPQTPNLEPSSFTPMSPAVKEMIGQTPGSTLSTVQSNELQAKNDILKYLEQTASKPPQVSVAPQQAPTIVGGGSTTNVNNSGGNVTNIITTPGASLTLPQIALNLPSMLH
jgi:hypothetical protein